MAREEDFERWYAEHAEPLLVFLTMRTGDRSLAEDLVGETFVRVLRSRTRFDRRKASVKTWIYTIALNCLRDHARRRGAESRALEQSHAMALPGVAAAWDDVVSDRDALNRALATLSEEEREAITLRYGADLTVPEIAKVLGEPLQRVEGRVYRALRKLREELP
ncbi:MAG: sigma-70 family RNA polymerase sigma factor [Actinomycetota bacterium]|nr:sigma-70 family RNA polymerase sigma factor [Actinomycetota bacterium]MDQ5808683.1 sigma-70 family RNA polymerase sigma factor [Actinomycetota bacterium]